MIGNEDFSPMANQHLHLTGAMSVDYLRENATQTEAQILLDAKDFDAPEIWAIAKHLTSTPDGFLNAIKHVIDRQINDGVNHVELTFNPYGMLRRGMSVDEIVESATNSAAYAQTSGVKLLLRPGVNRKDGPGTVSCVESVYNAFPEELSLGIDLNGDERLYPTEAFIAEFGRLSADGVPTSIHAGEFPGLVSSLHAAIQARPRRIGHAVATLAEPSLIDKILESGATIEVALTSNLVRGAVPSITAHPIRDFVARGIPVVFGTDDPTFFNNTMKDEHMLLDAAGIGRTELGDFFIKDS